MSDNIILISDKSTVISHSWVYREYTWVKGKRETREVKRNLEGVTRQNLLPPNKILDKPLPQNNSGMALAAHWRTDGYRETNGAIIIIITVSGK